MKTFWPHLRGAGAAGPPRSWSIVKRVSYRLMARQSWLFGAVAKYHTRGSGCPELLCVTAKFVIWLWPGQDDPQWVLALALAHTHYCRQCGSQRRCQRIYCDLIDDKFSCESLWGHSCMVERIIRMRNGRWRLWKMKRL